MMSPTKAVPALAALILAFGLAGCGNEPAGTDTTAPKPADSAPPAAEPGPAVTPSPSPSLPESKDAAPAAPAEKKDEMPK